MTWTFAHYYATYCEPWLLISKGSKIQIKTMNTLSSAEKAVCGANQIELQPEQAAKARVVNGELSQAIKKEMWEQLAMMVERKYLLWW